MHLRGEANVSDSSGTAQPRSSSNDQGGSPAPQTRWLPNLLLTFLLVTVLGGLITAYLQHRNDQLNALNEQRATTLQTYIDNIRSLLLDHKLTNQAGGGDARQVARVQTLNTLRSLGADRNKIVLQFLQDGGLIKTQDPVVDLSNSDLSGDDLSGANLSGIDLNGANLTGAHLNGADLSGATLYGTDLDNTDLSAANLRNAFLFDARLNGANLNGADLSYAVLTSAFLGSTNMNGATLTGARLNGAILTRAQLTGGHLSGANLINADLTDTNLSGADLSDADLVSNLTQQQLNTVSSCTSAILSKGLTCQPICKYVFRSTLICSRPSVQLTYWYTEGPAEVPVIVRLIHQFERKNPQIHINAVNTNYYQTEAAFENAVEEGNAPDVLRSDVGWVAQFASEGYLLNINPYIHQGGLSDYMSVPLSYDHYKGGLYGLPQVTDFLALLYNKAEVRKAVGTASPPSNMDNFRTYAEKIVQKKAAMYGFETDGTGYDTLPFLYAFGGGMLDQHGHILVDSKGSINGLEFLVGLQNDPKIQVMPKNVNFINAPGGRVLNDFADGKTAIIFGGPYNVPAILAGRAFKNHHGNLGIAAIPGCPAGPLTCHQGHTGAPSGGQSYVISAHTTHPIEAYKFIAFMSSPSSQVAIAKKNQTLPTRISVYHDKAVTKKRFIAQFCRIAKTAVVRPVIPQSGHLFDAFDPNIAAALDGVESPTVALKAVADAWKQLLSGAAVTFGAVNRAECHSRS
jgi:arabinogalactan oligomer / maltooligosaccharide transport system substrate-binding protein